MKTSQFPIIFLLICFSAVLRAQENTSVLVPSDTLNKERFKRSLVGGLSVYGLGSTWLWTQWYKGFERSPFQFYNDQGSWASMDKAGHFFSAYQESRIAYQYIKWTGLSDKKSLWTAVGIGSGVQLTFEIMDGFSEKWGFSIPDVAFNTLGVGLFASQELLWSEQRMVLKSSNSFKAYPGAMVEGIDGTVVRLEDRAVELYGSGPGARYLKDYNTMNIWLSVNPSSFIKSGKSSFPSWLNIALGYGAENLYGGFENEWPAEDPVYFLDPVIYPRYSQYYLSLDVDFTRIETKSAFLKTLFELLNLFKFPAPALEYNRIDGFRFIPMYW